MEENDPLPNEDQRRKLCELIYEAFIELRGISEEPERVHDLAYAFHNLPLTMYGWGTWRVDGLRASLGYYRRKHPGPYNAPDYVAMLDAIYPRV